MSLSFPYQRVTTSTSRPFSRPLAPIRIRGRLSSQLFPAALIDTGSQDCIFPWGAHNVVGAAMRGDAGDVLRWRGRAYPLRFGDVELEMSDGAGVWRWPATVAFSQAPLPYVILGYFGCLQYLDATFRGRRLVLELNVNASYPGTQQ